MAMKDDIFYLREAIAIAWESRNAGNHPFGALLVDPDGEIVVRAGNTHAIDKGIGHAELNVAREAAVRFAPEILERSTLVTSVEPCSMCAGGTYWAGIGTLVFGMSEARLATLTGDNPENLTMDLDCRRVLAAGRRNVEVRGPYPELEGDIVATHEGFW